MPPPEMYPQGAMAPHQMPAPMPALSVPQVPSALGMCGQMSAHHTLSAGSSFGDGDEDDGDDSLSNLPNKKFKHNVAERRRTSRLNQLFEELSSLLSSRQDVFYDTGMRHSKVRSRHTISRMGTRQSDQWLRPRWSIALHPCSAAAPALTARVALHSTRLGPAISQ